jgi:ComF family protein
MIPALTYEFPVDQLIKAFKLHGRLHVGRLLAELLIDAVNQRQRRFDLLLPMPLHAWKRWRRGFNQAELLAEDLCRAIEIPTSRHVLRQVRQTQAMKSLNASERRAIITDAFITTQSLAGLRIGLIDDVVTTMATANEATRIIKAAGAQSVTVLCVARTLGTDQTRSE